jgi:quinol monooxygenase YgiN
MIIVHGMFPVKPDVRDDALELMRCMAISSRAEFGCITYEFYVGLSDPNTLMLFQEWDSVEALQDHMETEHMDEFVKNLPQVLDGEVATRRYEVRGTQDEHGEQTEVDLGSRYEPRQKIIH